MKEKQAETVFEETRLAKTVAVAEEQLRQAEKSIGEKKAEMIEAKRDIRENTEFSFTDLNDPDDFEALVNLSQYDNLVTKIAADYEEEKRTILRLEALIKSPYFARIDFRFEEEAVPEQIYIGRSSLTEKSSREIYVYDWRSPIAGVFYRFMPGTAFYDAPGGRIYGEVSLKRQYEIKDGVLQYFFDTSLNINDEILRQILSQNASPRMKAIVETIQREQDIVIRDMENDLLMVQGVAGSGKTSIALHRAAYLMYQGLQTRLSADSILIISPNSAFEQYISGVLPELGEQNIVSATFGDILANILKDRQIQSYADFLETVFDGNRYAAVVRAGMRFKMSEDFLRILNQFLDHIPLRWIDFPDISYRGECLVTKQELRERILRKPETPLGMRLEQLESYVLERIFGTGRPRHSREEQLQIRQTLQAAVSLDIPTLYSKIFQDKAYFDGLAGGVDCPDDLNEIRRYTLENLSAGLLQYDDALAIAYLSLRIHGADKYRNIKQVVIDEAQDYYPLQYEMFGLLFPNAKFTVLGDVNQTLAKREDLSLYTQIRSRLNRPKASLITLDKSFRCTNEILNFSLQFIMHRPEIQSFNRRGGVPRVASFGSRRDLLRAICEEALSCRAAGLGSVCLLCKTGKNCAALFADLKTEIDVELIKDNQAEELQGIFTMPVYLSKGLEFDAVIVCDASCGNYCDEDDKRLLYVECTRALHRLSLFCEGSVSPLIPG